jgi:hypothetical protein
MPRGRLTLTIKIPPFKCHSNKLAFLLFLAPLLIPHLHAHFVSAFEASPSLVCPSFMSPAMSSRFLLWWSSSPFFFSDGHVDPFSSRSASPFIPRTFALSSPFQNKNRIFLQEKNFVSFRRWLHASFVLRDGWRRRKGSVFPPFRLRHSDSHLLINFYVIHETFEFIIVSLFVDFDFRSCPWPNSFDEREFEKFGSQCFIFSQLWAFWSF